ncbi:BnaA09g29670D [Brassica napus]|uniref:(rape) hypothetical protein n=1 Tax=Brassica napus TaxID=3708 RepID=A0A078FV03_BRANA|nr:unnamed protein product [Brassica napus]CDY16233.1 BnaA09g29670D [Brassica napus]
MTKLFSKEKKKSKALAEVKGSTRTLSMVLRSERELLSMNKDQEISISELKFQLEDKNQEVEKLKDLCLKQGGDKVEGTFVPMLWTVKCRSSMRRGRSSMTFKSSFFHSMASSNAFLKTLLRYSVFFHG